MPDRDLDITKFSFYAYRKLKKTLGEFCLRWLAEIQSNKYPKNLRQIKNFTYRSLISKGSSEIRSVSKI